MAAEPQPVKKALSKNVMAMKFMKRKVEADYRRQLEQEKQRAIEESHWVLQGKEERESCIEFEASYVNCEDLYQCGRMSFKKFNPAVEKLFKEMLAKEEEAKSQEWESEESVSDEEMTRRYDSLVETVGKKFSKKRKMLSVDAALDALSPSIQKPAKKKKTEFMKPRD
ncbi:PREDICTED: M-phase phosphoprotein 6-like [Acropora digitifera]|uniref:M-phase phosphoprotein 6-like n=1 Tax=Acropora digitifera TaxID=70779 RepID=UPI00077B1E6D|nr:PREDICTED: M-phase phosphoprotein 6-like [Acropora digitifera]